MRRAAAALGVAAMAAMGLGTAGSATIAADSTVPAPPASAPASTPASAPASTPAGGSTAPTGHPELCAAGDNGAIKIGILSQIKGESPTAIDDLFFGAKMAVDELNTLCAKPVAELTRYPADFTADSLEQELLKAQEAKEVVILGGSSSAQLAKNNVVTEGKIPVLWPVGASQGVKGGASYSDFAYLMRPVNDVSGELWAQYAVDSGAKKVFMECITTPLGVNGCKNAEDVLKAAGVEIVGRADSAPDASDFTNSATKIKETGADYVIVAQFPKPMIAFAKALEDNGVQNVTMIGGASTELIYKALTPWAQEHTVGISDCAPLESQPAVAAAYAAMFDGKEMNSLSATTYDSVHLALDAVIRAGSSDPAKVNEAIGSTQWKGVCHEYRNNGSHAMAHQDLILSFKDGKPLTVKTYELNDDGTALKK